MAQNPLKELNKLGQSVWLDYIRRGEIVSGDLKRLIDEDGLSGVTSNPSIFEKAIAGSKDYDAAIASLGQAGKTAREIFDSLAIEDIQNAADLFRPAYESTGGRDGFVSIEVAPGLAHDTAGSVAEARRLWRAVNRPNVLIKIPGTKEGLPAIEQALGEGININITLLFAVERYEQVAYAYLAALEKLAREGKPLDRVASVASFFVSRIDTLVEQQLDAKLRDARAPAERARIESLQGKIAIANAKVAYQKFKEIFSGPRFRALAGKGARVQRALWASTSTKNPKYRDVLYVETLIGGDTINTMPPATIAAFRDHGQARATVEESVAQARLDLEQLAAAGLDLRAVTAKLEEEGVAAFSRDFEKLLEVIEEKRRRVLVALCDKTTAALGKLEASVARTLAKLDERNFARRLWDRDATLWKSEPEHQKIIKNALGWLTVSRSLLEHVEALSGFAEEARAAGFKHAVLLGMGGSSLCPDVCRATFGVAPGYLELRVLDSTVAAAVSSLEKSVDLARALFLVSSKSGGTTETLSFYKYFFERVRSLKGGRANENFVAITDEGSSLDRLAVQQRFRKVFHGHADIGGRYSALSNFGMAPAALAGINVRGMLERAERMVHACACCVAARENPGVSLGVVLAEAARAGRDKVTLVMSPGIATFGDWAEQLIAESTGKEGKGLVPVAGEDLGEPSVYGNDRLFVRMRLAAEGDGETDRKLDVLENAGHPVVRIELPAKLDLGQEFFRWEMAVAAAGALMGIDAFDQPNVQESKDNTNRLLAQFRSQGKLEEEAPVGPSVDGLKFYCDPATKANLARSGRGGSATLTDGLTTFLGEARGGDYLALMAYLEPSREHAALLRAIRLRLRDALRLATTLGFGPRFLHSTGQLHKGGANNGLFIQITAEDARDLPIPGEPYTFSTLKRAQALGDAQSLQGKGRRVVRFHLSGEVRAGLAQLLKVVESAVGETQKARA